VGRPACNANKPIKDGHLHAILRQVR
jgi:hypothetical protein